MRCKPGLLLNVLLIVWLVTTARGGTRHSQQSFIAH